MISDLPSDAAFINFIIQIVFHVHIVEEIDKTQTRTHLEEYKPAKKMIIASSVAKALNSVDRQAER